MGSGRDRRTSPRWRAEAFRAPAVALSLLLVTAACSSPPSPAQPRASLSVDPASEARNTAADTAGNMAAVSTWAHTLDHRSLSQALSPPAFELPPGTSIYGVRVVEDQRGLAYEEFDAGGGALDTEFWPASTVKVVAALGTLEFLARFGLTGSADVVIDGVPYNVRALYEEAIRDSSNEAYDFLLQIAGVDWLNTEFLTPAKGFSTTVIQRSYAGWNVRSSPAMTIVEGDTTMELEPRESTGEYECPDDGNCSNLLELTDAIRRIVLAAEIPDHERFAVSAADVPPLQEALLAAEGFIETGATAALGDGVLVYSKPGEFPDHQCVDVALVDDQSRNQQYLVGVTTPSDGGECADLSFLAALTLHFLSTRAP